MKLEIKLPGVKLTVDIDEKQLAPESLTLLERLAGRNGLPGYQVDFDHDLAGMVARVIASGQIRATDAREAMQDAWPDREA